MRRYQVTLPLLLCVCAADARVTRFVVEKRESAAYGGKSFGAAGQFETLSGHFYGELDPKDPYNTIITDIQFAPRNARGMVEYSATFALSKPIDMSHSNAVLFYSVPNRGNGGPSGSNDGRVSVVSGWQGDLILSSGKQTIEIPVAKNTDGSPITGPVIERFINIPDHASTVALNSQPYTALTYQKPFTLDTSKASLMQRTSQTAAPTAVPSGEWAFADCSAMPFPGTPDPTKLCVKGGFDGSSEYVVSFIARDPLVLGIGFAATRDLNSFLRYSDKDSAGNANPVAGKIKWAIGQGNA